MTKRGIRLQTPTDIDAVDRFVRPGSLTQIRSETLSWTVVDQFGGMCLACTFGRNHQDEWAVVQGVMSLAGWKVCDSAREHLPT